MLRPASREEVRAIALPLYLLLNSAHKQKDDFDIVLAGALSIVANLAYCAIGAEERERRIRAKLVPCQLYERLLLGESFDFVQRMSEGLDFAGTTVVRTKFFVAIIVPAGEMIIVGIRGTQFAYDWLLNLQATKRVGQNEVHYHSGFYKEADKLWELLRIDLQRRFGTWRRAGRPNLYFTGHSLGGAIAAILNQQTEFPPAIGCYTFGAPRICAQQDANSVRQPFAMRRDLDVVPHCPPLSLNFAEYTRQKDVDGTPYVSANALEFYFFLRWLGTMAIYSFPEHHSMERYVQEVVGNAVRDHRVEEYWNRPGSSHRENWPF
ncbi:MAG: hypothetical protein QOC72_3948 [Methylobacteriaceae bacterium]|jgi:hypothetical protein|nr:hypothetical protein [Methylobacteriaceae bacterium]